MSLNSLTTLNAPALTTVTGSVIPQKMTSLVSMTLPAIVSIGGSIGDGGSGGLTALETFTLGATLKSVGGNVDFGTTSGAILNEASVDNILVRLAGLDGTNGTTSYDTHTINLAGTCAIPSAAGLAAKATLEVRGCTVTVNS